MSIIFIADGGGKIYDRASKTWWKRKKSPEPTDVKAKAGSVRGETRTYKMEPPMSVPPIKEEGSDAEMCSDAQPTGR